MTRLIGPATASITAWTDQKQVWGGNKAVYQSVLGRALLISEKRRDQCYARGHDTTQHSSAASPSHRTSERQKHQIQVPTLRARVQEVPPLPPDIYMSPPHIRHTSAMGLSSRRPIVP